MVDVVVVSYNSAAQLPRCVGALASAPDVRVTVVDNASADASLAVLAGLPARTIALERNGGFARGCNAGWRAGDGELVLFLNPDAAIAPDGVRALAAALADPRVGAAGPRIVDEQGRLHFSQRRLPTGRAALAQALFLHRALPRAGWAQEAIRDPAAYERPGEPDWVSGACVMLRRRDLERLGGWDERFFLYREDIDLCRRVRGLGLTVRFEPAAQAVHAGGASAPLGRTVPVLAASRLRYARKYGGARRERALVALHAATHALLARGAPVRRGHREALRTALRAR
jgi:GT2 family glycosyltransferase